MQFKIQAIDRTSPLVRDTEAGVGGRAVVAGVLGLRTAINNIQKKKKLPLC